MRHLLHLFYPSYRNNHKARLLHTSSLSFLVGLVVIYQIVLASIPLSGSRVLGYAANISIDEVVSITNSKRAETGAGNLTVSPLLSEAARRKGEHMLANNYWAHVAPDGTEPWKFFGDVGYTYRYAGENLARDFTNATSAVDAWMASPSHKENLLSAKYQEIGAAVVEGDLNGVDTTIIVQLFGTRNLAEQITVPEVAAADAAAVVGGSLSDNPEITPSVEPVQAESEQVPESGSVAQTLPSAITPSLSPLDLTRAFSLSLVGILLIALVVDGFIIFQKRIPRVSGRSIAHFAFLAAVFVIVVIARAGAII